MRIAICDDDVYAIDVLAGIIGRWVVNQTRPIEVEKHDSPESFLFSMDRATFDVAFLDIKMGSMSGIDLAQIIRRRDTHMMIVFVTNYAHLALQGFSVQATGYLPKPVNEDECIKVLDNIMDTYKKRETEVFSYQDATQTIIVSKADIIYFQSRGHYIKIVHNQVHGREYLEFRMSMVQLEEQLPYPQFFRSHKSYIINLYHVFRMYKDSVLMSNGETLLLGKRKWTELNECYRATRMNPDDKGSIFCVVRDQG